MDSEYYIRRSFSLPSKKFRNIEIKTWHTIGQMVWNYLQDLDMSGAGRLTSSIVPISFDFNHINKRLDFTVDVRKGRGHLAVYIWMFLEIIVWVYTSHNSSFADFYEYVLRKYYFGREIEQLTQHEMNEVYTVISQVSEDVFDYRWSRTVKEEYSDEEYEQFGFCPLSSYKFNVDLKPTSMEFLKNVTPTTKYTWLCTKKVRDFFLKARKDFKSLTSKIGLVSAKQIQQHLKSLESNMKFMNEAHKFKGEQLPEEPI